MRLLHALALFLSAGLLFSMQPMVARMGLPMLGGSPSVWNTCMVFFQAAVLAGYALADLLARRVSHKAQVGLFGLLIVAGFSVQPLQLVTPGADPGSSPAAWLLGRLLVAVGLPALALATSSPLVQRWFHRGAGRDPYFLYAASNLGSLGALLAYPLWIEPALRLAEQAQGWRWGYAVWGALVLGLGVAGNRTGNESTVATSDDVPVPAAPGFRTMAGWALLGAIPASLLQGCTLFLTTDIASIPMLWVIPLAVYLFTFVLAFDVRSRIPVQVASRALPYLAVALLFALLTRATEPVGLLLVLHLGFLFAGALACHGRLFEQRPHATHLTRFYLAMAVGGVLGGAFNSFVAPRIFSAVTEYPIAISAACAFALTARKRNDGEAPDRLRTDVLTAVAIGAAVLVVGGFAGVLLKGQDRLRDGCVFGLAALACWTLLHRPRRFGMALLSVFLSGGLMVMVWNRNQVSLRNFFGITRVTQDAEGRFRQLMHGNTFHGRQFLDPAQKLVPLTYYHPQGPVGDAFRARRSLSATTNASGLQVGVIGLGVGSLSAYVRGGDSMTYFEIDPAVIRVASSPLWFTFLTDCRTGQRPRIVVGDGRLRLSREPEGQFDLLVLDAFSSDSIPVHLLTQEAFELYRTRVKPNGWLLVHISNRYLDLEPVVAAAAASLGLTCRSFEDDDPKAPGQEASHWLLLARSEADLGPLMRSVLWKPATARPEVKPWTDERASLWSVWRW
jgi:hypothetical protein